MKFQNLKLYFLLITILCVLILMYNLYQNYHFKNNPLNAQIMERIHTKEQVLKQLSFKYYRISQPIPIVISEKMPNRLYGAATWSQDKQSKIYLNKKRFQENLDYMIDSVLPHEYAHAVMFQLGDTTKENGGHSKKWQQICLRLEGKRCNRFVDNHDILLEKTNPF